MTAMPSKPARRASKGPKFIVDQIWDGAPDEASRHLGKPKVDVPRGRRSVRLSFGKKKNQHG